MRVLIIGAEGQVGHFLLSAFPPPHGVHGTSLDGVSNLPALDIRDEIWVQQYLKRVRPDHVILTAALTHVDYCEEHPDEAEAINTQGAENVARACAEVNAGLTFFSSDYVFDGKSGPYQETDRTHPLSVYGRTKLAGEQAVAKLVKNHLIVRTMVVYSYLPGSVNLFMQIYQRIRENLPVSQPEDQMVNPTQAENLALALAELILGGATGLYHLAGTTRLSRLDFARRVVEKLDRDPASVQGQTTAALKQKAPRPLNSGLITDKAQARLAKNKLWDLDTALEHTLAQMQR
jgi:dTDP-4-dehydrorhamnose reductase